MINRKYFKKEAGLSRSFFCGRGSNVNPFGEAKMIEMNNPVLSGFWVGCVNRGSRPKKGQRN